MKKDPEILLRYILESINEIEKNIKNMKEADFLKSVTIQDATIRRLEIIGEAVKNIPISFKNKYTETPWKKIAGMRDMLIHEYFGVDLNLVWKILNKNIPELKKDILFLLNNLH